MIFIKQTNIIMISALQVIFCTKKQEKNQKIRKCSDKITYLRANKAHFGCGICSRISNLPKDNTRVKQRYSYLHHDKTTY
ncbi:MAG: hypothetical protein DRH03_03630 [Deltaproteobacteria bacterium]|nr:MAG: hypothetical protein DRH03_03630 [Deltaproteobacteria bacterium]